jgi:hypothetical protein
LYVLVQKGEDNNSFYRDSIESQKTRDKEEEMWRTSD